MAGRSNRSKTDNGIVHVKALSVNQCWLGRKRKSGKYRGYEKVLMDQLPDSVSVPARGNLMLYIRFGHSNRAFDWDNGVKPFQDILQTKYGFDDKRIYFAIVEKDIVKRGEEYIYFKIKKLGLIEKLRMYIKEIFG